MIKEPHGIRLKRLWALEAYRKALAYYRKDVAFRRENDGKTAEEMWPLSVGYSPYSGMTHCRVR